MTWTEFAVILGVAVTTLTAIVAGTSAMIQWRMDALQRQLADRLNLFNQQMDLIKRRLNGPSNR